MGRVFRHLRANAVLALIVLTACSEDRLGPAVAGGGLDDGGEASWVRSLSPFSQGEVVASARFPYVSAQQWANMGFVPLGNGAWKRAVRIDATVELVEMDVPELPSVDCIAIISVDRDTGDEPYIYRTLRSLFRNLPDGVEVNVVVGDARAEYLSPARLHEVVGPARAARVHVHATDVRTDAFLQENFLHPRQRAAWNAARVLRSYRGTRGLLAMEDDVIWTAAGLAPLERIMPADRPPLITLFNKPCAKLPGAPAQQPLEPELVRPDLAGHQFLYTQGLWYAPTMAEEGGRYLREFVHDNHYDIMLDKLLRRRGWQVGYLYPGILQHIGYRTAVESDAVPISHCMADLAVE